MFKNNQNDLKILKIIKYLIFVKNYHNKNKNINFKEN